MEDEDYRDFIIEGRHCSKDDLAKAAFWPDKKGNIKTERPSIDDIEKAMEVFKKLKAGNTPFIEQTQDDRYAFKYVGLLSFRKMLFAILPKYYGDSTKPEEGVVHLKTSKTLSILKEAIEAAHQQAITRNSKPGQDKTQDKLEYIKDSIDAEKNGNNKTKPIIEENRLDLFKFIIDDYRNHGVYTTSSIQREVNGTGPIEPERTLETSPTMIDGDPFYVPITRKKSYVQNWQIANIQQSIVSEIDDYIQQSGLSIILDYEKCHPSMQKVSHWGTLPQLQKILKEELEHQRENRKQRLLKAMIRYLKNSSQATSDTIAAEGTCDFEHVWESICQKIFEHENRYLSKPKWNYDSDDTIVKLFTSNEIAKERDSSKPSDESLEDNHHIQPTAFEYSNESGKLIPDIIHVTESGECYILDAKYYMPQYDDDKIDNIPAIGDIIKQYFYAMVLNSMSGIKTIKGNALILPARLPLEADDDSYAFLIKRGNIELKFQQVSKPVQYVDTSAPNDSNSENRVSNMQRNPNTTNSIEIFEMNPAQAIRIYLHSQPGENAQTYLNQMFPTENSTPISRIMVRAQR